MSGLKIRSIRRVLALIFFAISVFSLVSQTIPDMETAPGILNSKIAYYSHKESEGSILLIVHALSWLGTPYRLGGMSRTGVDCSGFVNQVLAATFPDIGVIPRRSEDFFSFGVVVTGILPGDILLFAQDSSVYHVGIALSDTTFIHAASEGTRTGVIVSSIGEGRWKNHLFGIRRIGI